MCMLDSCPGLPGLERSPLGRCEEMATAITHKGVTLQDEWARTRPIALCCACHHAKCMENLNTSVTLQAHADNMSWLEEACNRFIGTSQPLSY